MKPKMSARPKPAAMVDIRLTSWGMGFSVRTPDSSYKRRRPPLIASQRSNCFNGRMGHGSDHPPTNTQECDMDDQDNSSREKLWDLIKDIKFAMFTTHHRNGHLHSRPMTTQNTKVDEDSSL